MTTLRQHREESDRAYLEELMQYTDGNVGEAARIAGVHRGSFYRLLAQHRIDPPNGNGFCGIPDCMEAASAQ